MNTRIAELLVVLIGSLAAFPASAQGTLSSADHPLYGANTLTVDTRTGLAWLDLPITRGLSYESVRAATEPGGSFYGFRFASVDEVSGLFADAGLPGQGWYATSDPGAAPIVSLISLLGATSVQDGYPETFGITGTVGGSGSHQRGGLDFSYVNAVAGYSAWPSFGSWGDSTVSESHGSWLVTHVPEPSVWRFGMLAGLLLVGRRLLSHRHDATGF